MLRCRRHVLSNIPKLLAAFLFLVYHQRARKTSLCHMRGVDYTNCNTCCTFTGADPGFLKGGGILGLQAKKGGGFRRGSNFGPNVKKPPTWAKKGGSRTPCPPRRPRAAHALFNMCVYGAWHHCPRAYACTGSHVPDRMYRIACTGSHVPDRMYRIACTMHDQPPACLPAYSYILTKAICLITGANLPKSLAMGDRRWGCHVTV